MPSHDNGGTPRARRGADQPMYTEARGRSWEIWVKVAASGPRRRIRTWIEVQRDVTSGQLLGGGDAKAIHDEIAKLWNSPTPRWELLCALVTDGVRPTLQELYDVLVERGLAGADDLLRDVRVAQALSEAKGQTDESTRAAMHEVTTLANSTSDPDLVPFLEAWEASPLDRQDGRGSITATTRAKTVTSVIRLVAPELLRWRNSTVLALRDGRPLPRRPDVQAFAASCFTAERIRQHLSDTYKAQPTAAQLKELEKKNPKIREAVEQSLKGHGDGAVAAFNAFRVFARWLVTRGVIASDPTERMRRPKKSEPKPTKLETNADIELLASLLPAPFDDIWRVMCGSGLEPTVALELSVTDVEITTKETVANGSKNKHRERRVETGPIAAEAAERAVAAARTAGRQRLWPARDIHGGVVTRFTLGKHVARAAQALVDRGHHQFAGIVPYSARPRSVSWPSRVAPPCRTWRTSWDTRTRPWSSGSTANTPLKGRVRDALATHGGAHDIGR